MVNAIQPISPSRIEPTRLAPKLEDTLAPAQDGKLNFGSIVGGALDQLATSDAKAALASQAAATGDVASVGEYMVAATEAQLTAELTVAVRNRAIEAFNDIMRMQI